MNAIENIKTQVFNIVVYKENTIEGIDQEYDLIGDRLFEGIKKMKESGLFTEAEVEDVTKYAGSLRNKEYDKRRDEIIRFDRANFVF